MILLLIVRLGLLAARDQSSLAILATFMWLFAVVIIARLGVRESYEHFDFVKHKIRMVDSLLSILEQSASVCCLQNNSADKKLTNVFKTRSHDHNSNRLHCLLFGFVFWQQTNEWPLFNMQTTLFKIINKVKNIHLKQGRLELQLQLRLQSCARSSKVGHCETTASMIAALPWSTSTTIAIMELQSQLSYESQSLRILLRRLWVETNPKRFQMLVRGKNGLMGAWGIENGFRWAKRFVKTVARCPINSAQHFEEHKRPGEKKTEKVTPSKQIGRKSAKLLWTWDTQRTESLKRLNLIRFNNEDFHFMAE